MSQYRLLAAAIAFASLLGNMAARGSDVAVSSAGSIAQIETPPSKGLGDRLKEATRRVDRVVVTPPVSGYPDSDAGPDTPLFEVKARSAIESLVELMEFEQPPEGIEMPCLCDGTHRLQFFSGDNFKFVLSYHHWNRLRGDFGGPWGGDAVMTDLGRERFMQWFSDRGFAEFQQGLAQVDDYSKDTEAKRAQIATLFPRQAQTWVPKIDSNRSWDREDERRSVELAALYANKVELLQTCWRALGLMTEWRNQWSLRVYGEPGGFVLKILKAAGAEDIREALRDITKEDVHVQLGSLRHFASLSSGDEKIPGWGRERLVALARFYLQHGPPEHLDGLVSLLSEMDVSTADDVLIEIGRRAAPKSDPVPEEDFAYFPQSPEVLALFKLAERRNAAAREIIQDKLRAAPEGEDRWTLEVANACYESHPVIRREHLLAQMDHGHVAERAWRMLCPEETSSVEISLLAAAAGSPSYKVKQQATAKLSALGLQRLESKNAENAKAPVIDPKLAGEAAVEACSIALTAKPPQRQRTELLKRRGIEYLKLGDFELAVRDLRSGYRAAPYEHAFAALCVGRYGEGMDVAFRSTEGESADKFLRLRGCVYYAMDRFQEAADEFTAAYVLGGGEYNLVLRHMSLLHLGRGADSPIVQWEPVFDQGKQTWPNALFYFLKGELPDTAMLAAALDEKGREANEDRSFAYWVLAEMARKNGDVSREREHLNACLGVQSFTSLAHALALRRIQALNEEDRYSSAR